MMQVPTQVKLDLSQIASGCVEVFVAQPKPGGFSGKQVFDLQSDVRTEVWTFVERLLKEFGDVQVCVYDRYHRTPDFVPNPSEAEFAKMVTQCLDNLRDYYRKVAERTDHAIDVLNSQIDDESSRLHLEPLTA